MDDFKVVAFIACAAFIGALVHFELRAERVSSWVVRTFDVAMVVATGIPVFWLLCIAVMS